MLRWTALGCCLLLASPQDPADKIQGLIEKLGSEEIAVRDEAERQLERIGFEAVPALKRAAQGNVGESKVRIDRLIGRLTAFGRPIHITIDAKDRPLREIAAEVERQCGIPIRLIGAAADARASVAGRQEIAWNIIEEICKGRGDLMYRFANDTIEIYPAKFRTLPRADSGSLRFIVDRFVWDGNHFWQYGAVLAPAGSKVVRVHHDVHESADDLGNDPWKDPFHRMEPVTNWWPAFPSSIRFIYAFYFNRLNGRPPAIEASKLVRLRGTISVWLASEEKVVASIKDPLSRPSTPLADGQPGLGIVRWKAAHGYVSLQCKATWDEPAFRHPTTGPRMILRYKDGSWRSPDHLSQEESGPNPNQRWTIDRLYHFRKPDEAVATSFDMVGYDSLIKVEIPFDFRDIPLR